VRHCRAPKQRIWLGPDRYFCGCKRWIANTDTDGNAYGHCNVDGHAYTYGGRVGYAYCYGGCFGYAYCYGNAYRHLSGNLYDSYYHWHNNSGRQRYRQPLRRLHHGYRSTLPGKRIRPSAGYIGFCRVRRRLTLHRAL